MLSKLLSFSKKTQSLESIKKNNLLFLQENTRFTQPDPPIHFKSPIDIEPSVCFLKTLRKHQFQQQAGKTSSLALYQGESKSFHDPSSLECSVQAISWKSLLTGSYRL
ncbi:hypothetical protein CEXT_581701 [Caerostris extrusa]|uniref:Uncharacterized protein n=1 Tax=Caerostris extrusa TaxID=172846 RepID=A0AAV4TZ74_CAEEX|nr:hypothetical protein CEXT_581701 [Caerostris extrusa]